MIKLSENAFISKHCVITGNVELGENVSVWPKVVIRADIEYIKIGNNSNIQDGSVLHPNHGKPVIVGNNVTIGHNAIVHGCKVGDNCLVGMGAIILDGAVIGDNCIIAAGSIVSPGKNVPAGTLWMGSPAKYYRDVTQEELKHTISNADEYVQLALKARNDKEDFV